MNVIIVTRHRLNTWHRTHNLRIIEKQHRGCVFLHHILHKGQGQLAAVSTHCFWPVICSIVPGLVGRPIIPKETYIGTITLVVGPVAEGVGSEVAVPTQITHLDCAGLWPSRGDRLSTLSYLMVDSLIISLTTSVRVSGWS